MNAAIAVRKITSLVSDSTLRLGDLLSPVWKLLTLSLADESISPKKSLCVSIEREGLSIAYGSRFLSRISLKQVRRYPMELWVYPEAEDVASTVSLAVNELKAKRAEVTLCIPKAWAVLTTVEFPATVKENLSEVIAYELDRVTPFTSEEALFDFILLSEDAERIKILVAAVKREVITPYLDALREKGLKVGRLTMSLSGLGALCGYYLKKRDALFMDIGKSDYEGGVLAQGSAVAACMGTFASEDDSARSDVLAAEIEALAPPSPGGHVDVVLSFRQDTRHLVDLLREKLAAPPLILGEDEAKLRVPIQQKGISFVAIGGVVESLWPAAKRLNLLSGGRHDRVRTPKILTIALILAIVSLLGLYAFMPVQIEERRLKEIDRQISLRKDEVKKIEALKKDMEVLSAELTTIDTFKESRPMALNLIKELTNILPKSAWLTRVRFSDTGLEIEGYAATATELLSKIESSKHFQKVEFASPTFRDARLNSERFIIKAEIEGVKKRETEKAKGETQKSEKK
jgi:general secretion pathway protein L